MRSCQRCADTKNPFRVAFCKPPNQTTASLCVLCHASGACRGRFAHEALVCSVAERTQPARHKCMPTAAGRHAWWTTGIVLPAVPSCPCTGVYPSWRLHKALSMQRLCWRHVAATPCFKPCYHSGSVLQNTQFASIFTHPGLLLAGVTVPPNSKAMARYGLCLVFLTILLSVGAPLCHRTRSTRRVSASHAPACCPRQTQINPIAIPCYLTRGQALLHPSWRPHAAMRASCRAM